MYVANITVLIMFVVLFLSVSASKSFENVSDPPNSSPHTRTGLIVPPYNWTLVDMLMTSSWSLEGGAHPHCIAFVNNKGFCFQGSTSLTTGKNISMIHVTFQVTSAWILWCNQEHLKRKELSMKKILRIWRQIEYTKNLSCQKLVWKGLLEERTIFLIDQVEDITTIIKDSNLILIVAWIPAQRR
jgi:hypothetical protein